MSAAANGNIELLKLLLKYGAKPDYPTSAGGTGLRMKGALSPILIKRQKGFLKSQPMRH